jgi:hypothetical protein
VAGDRHVVFCLADPFCPDGPVYIGPLNALTGFPEDGKQDDDLASGLPEADQEYTIDDKSGRSATEEHQILACSRALS